MEAKVSPPSPANGGVRLTDSWFIPPLTLEARLVCIQALGQRIAGHIDFICGVPNLAGTSAEAKQKTVAVFYERLLALEQELARIQENLRLA
jgi:hypothetical protein